MGCLSWEGDLWSGLRQCSYHWRGPSFLYSRAAKVHATKKRSAFEETNKVKRRIYFVKQAIFHGPQISLISVKSCGQR